MKKILIASCFAFMLLLACTENKTNKEVTSSLNDTSTNSMSASKPEEMVTPPLDSATIMKNWMAYMTPGDVHKMMQSWNGSWTGEVSMWQAPGAPPEISKSTAINKTIMGGRYQVSNHTGSMMGQPFEGMSTLAYDNARKVFISTWIDNMGTGLMKMEGPWDEASKTIAFSGKSVDPSSGTGKEMDVRETFTIVDNNTQVMSMYGAGPDGKEFKMMEIKFTRK